MSDGSGDDRTAFPAIIILIILCTIYTATGHTRLFIYIYKNTYVFGKFIVGGLDDTHAVVTNVTRARVGRGEGRAGLRRQVAGAAIGPVNNIIAAGRKNTTARVSRRGPVIRVR